MLSFLIVSALLLASTAVAVPPFSTLRQLSTPAAPAACGIDSYDFSSLMTKDWAGLSDDYSELYYMNLCHTVQNLWCTLNPDTAAVQVCQVSPDDTEYTYNLMSNDTTATTWSYINQHDAKQGVQFQAQTGDASGGCPNQGRRITIGQLVCGNSTGIITSVVEEPACTYTFTLPTTVVCQAGQAVDGYAKEVARVRRVLDGVNAVMAASTCQDELDTKYALEE